MNDKFASLNEFDSIPVGKHCILELYGCPAHLLNNVRFIEKSLREAAKHAQSTFLKRVSYRFNPHGVTALVLLAESHISVHTWPESGFIAADVFTCGEHTQPERACNYLIAVFEAQKHSLITMPRGRASLQASADANLLVNT
ncbi:adenosylmethionine decarboxylase [Leptolyngbya sp. AN02str]|uniref:adenosylmethionine decarboxylase n=1 Tax=Leptolyngbya sp. AN02str TaxID=3423363 RepID=UPI003D311303